MSRRTARVQDLLRSEIAKLMLYQMKDPRVAMATVVAVNLSADLRHARVRVSALGSQDERQESIEALQHAAGFIRAKLARRVRIRVIPELTFELDRGAEHSQRIHDILESLDDNSTGT